MGQPIFSTAVPFNLSWFIAYTVPNGKKASVTINVAAIEACVAKVALTSGGGPVNANLIEPGQPLAIGGVLERTGIVLPAGHRVYVQTSVTGSLVAQVWGIEENV